MNDADVVISEAVLASCKRCRQALTVIDRDGRAYAYDRPSGTQHVCWDLPQDANLLVIDD